MNGNDDQVLSSWKEIASFFGKGVRTVQRWERQLGLPVRRPQGPDTQIVLARKSELASWMNGRANGKNGTNPNGIGLSDSLTRQDSDTEANAGNRKLHMGHMERMHRLMEDMQKQTEQLQVNTSRFIEYCRTVEETSSKQNAAKHGSGKT